MSRQARQQSNTGVYHVIQRGVNRMLIFQVDAERRMFLDLWKSQAGEFFKVYWCCWRDNHIHLIVKTSRVCFYIHRILSACGVWFNHKYEREGYLFQDRFKSEVIEDQGYLLRCFRYVLQNPLKAGLCHEISEYRWTSYSGYFNPVDSFVSTEFLTLFFDSKADFQAYMLEDEDGEFMEAGYQFKDHEVRKLLEEMLEGKSFEILTKVEQRQVLKVLKQNPNIGLRQLARITGVSLGIIHRL